MPLASGPPSFGTGIAGPSRSAKSGRVAIALGVIRMGWRSRLVERGKQIAMTPKVLKVLSDDRVMRAAEGVMDARTRMRAAASKAGEAWQVLTQGHALPSIDPSIVDDVDLPDIRPRIEPGENGANGHGGTDAANG